MEDTHERSRSSKQIRSPGLSAGRGHRGADGCDRDQRGLSVSDAWADDATTLTPATLKTLVKVARDIYPHDFLGDSYYIAAIKPWDGKAAKDPATKSLIQTAYPAR